MLFVRVARFNQIANCSLVKRTLSSHQIFSAVCLERLPTLAKEPNIVQRSMTELLNKYEISQSLYCDHELKHFEDLRRAKRLASGKDVDEKDLENASKQTAADFEDASNEEIKVFKFANRSSDNENSNKKSLSRHLDQRLLLVSKIKLGNKFQWLLPKAQWESGETLRQTAERALSSLLATDGGLEVKFLGNCPASVYTYKYPKPLRASAKSDGAKIFFFKAQVLSGSIEQEKCNTEKLQDFSWLNRSEFKELMHKEKQKRYWSAIDRSFLYEELDENFVPNVLSVVRSRLIGNSQKESIAVKS